MPDFLKSSLFLFIFVLVRFSIHLENAGFPRSTTNDRRRILFRLDCFQRLFICALQATAFQRDFASHAFQIVNLLSFDRDPPAFFRNGFRLVGFCVKNPQRPLHDRASSSGSDKVVLVMIRLYGFPLPAQCVIRRESGMEILDKLLLLRFEVHHCHISAGTRVRGGINQRFSINQLDPAATALVDRSDFHIACAIYVMSRHHIGRIPVKENALGTCGQRDSVAYFHSRRKASHTERGLARRVKHSIIHAIVRCNGNS